MKLSQTIFVTYSLVLLRSVCVLSVFWGLEGLTVEIFFSLHWSKKAVLFRWNKNKIMIMVCGINSI